MSEDEIIELMLERDKLHEALTEIYEYPAPCNDDEAWHKYWEVRRIALRALVNYNTE
jgi:hypothetical protein